MIACTSISPNHINNDCQKIATDSWLSNGIEVYSFNCENESEALKSLYPDVKFVTTPRTMEHHFGKPYVSINGVMDWCKKQNEDNFCLINSDIELSIDKNLIDKIEKELPNKVLIANRWDYNIDKEKATLFTAGIDISFINKKHFSIYPQSIYCFGQCHWDYWIPYRAIMAGVNVEFLDNKFAFHKKHKAQYNYDHWLKTGRYFLWENNLYQFDDRNGIPNMSKYVFNILTTGINRVQL